VFTFSERPGTVAAAITGKVQHNIKEARSKELISLSHEKSASFHLLNEGMKADVLFENERSSGMISGFTPNYIRVEHPWKSKLAGKIVEASILNTPDGKVKAEINEEE
ncbi:MAG TPA: tRNA (N(6)-L-threonylcarbamoyladenosine(37)-C(2))-methylthiotransferase MtaB, partial [Bacteroidales bacterium]|nr:tRNA (N(6)-L-threonylcarbamoyladenosine(37)-C(2))-methylthiotransferase MtaB [Bacteroidales bacterium]